MRIKTRIISGYGLFIAILAGLVVFQVYTIDRMQEINRTLSKINFQNALDCLLLLKDRDLVAEITEKSFSFADPDYMNRLNEIQIEFEKSLMELKRNVHSDEEQVEIKRLLQHWQTFTRDVTLLQKRLSREGAPYQLPEVLREDLDQLRIQTDSVYQVILKSMRSKVENSQKTGETAVLVLWIATIFVFAASILVSLLIVRSISKPLAHLTDGTRAIADGKFFYRLDTSRNDEFSQLARDFNKMTLRLNELDEMKKDFVSHVSHELKVPLASMRETIQLMLDQIPGPLTDKQKRLLELNLQSGTRLTSMIGNLLDLSKIEAGVMEYEMKSQDLVPLVFNAIAELDAHAQERQIRIQTMFPEKPVYVECDDDRIVQVIINIAGNAVKFSPKQTAINIMVESIRSIPEKIPNAWRPLFTSPGRDNYFGLVTVTDAGPGIPDSDKEAVFEKFHQVKKGKKMPGQGVGLGLAICKTIVQAHRGAVWVEDNPGGGSQLKLLLRPGQPGDEVKTPNSSSL
jgi:signal transduction histidine kinase